MTQAPDAVELALDYSLLEPHELVQFRALIEKAMPKGIEASEGPTIEGAAMEE